MPSASQNGETSKYLDAESKLQLEILKGLLRRMHLDEQDLLELVNKEKINHQLQEKIGDISREIMRRFRIQNKKLREQVSLMKDRSRQQVKQQQALEAEAARLRILLKSVAEALGACPLCMGEDLACPTCSGAGLPGWKPVSRRAFNQYILPVMDALKTMSKPA
jgi:hypothetical protein